MRDPTVIIDTGPLVAFLVEDDIHHAWSVSALKSLLAPFLTCEPVLTETYHLVHRLPCGSRRFFDLLDSGLLLVDVSLLAERRALSKLALKYSDLPMSLADACIVRLAELNPGSAVFTVDGHFRIYRKNGRQVIPTIMPPISAKRRSGRHE